MAKPVRIFVSLSEHNWQQFQGSKISTLRKCSRKCQFYHLFYTLKYKNKTWGVYMKFTGDRLGRVEKAKGTNLWDWVKCKMDRHILPLHLYVWNS